MQDRLIQLTYASTATFKTDIPGGIESEVARILLQSRRNNAKIAVGGVLHYGDGYFFQCLEGEEAIVNYTYNRVAKDLRHKNVKILSRTHVQQRLFENWSMKYLALEKNLLNVMRLHGLDSFNPYAFSQPLIADLLKVCAQGIEPKAFASNQSLLQKANLPWWKRWFRAGETGQVR